MLTLKAKDDTGVRFGQLNNNHIFVDEKDRDKYPARVVIPHAIWEAEGKKRKMVVSIQFVDDDAEVKGFDNVFLMIGEHGSESQKSKKVAKRSGKKRQAKLPSTRRH